MWMHLLSIGHKNKAKWWYKGYVPIVSVDKNMNTNLDLLLCRKQWRWLGTRIWHRRCRSGYIIWTTVNWDRKSIMILKECRVIRIRAPAVHCCCSKLTDFLEGSNILQGRWVIMLFAIPSLSTECSTLCLFWQ